MYEIMAFLLLRDADSEGDIGLSAPLLQVIAAASQVRRIVDRCLGKGGKCK